MATLWLFMLSICYCFGMMTSQAVITMLPCPKNICVPIHCRPVNHCPDGRITTDASFCGCCPACLKFLKQGEVCQPGLRVPRLHECGPDLDCDPDSKTCEPK